MLITCFGFAQVDGFTIEGEISITETGDIYIFLVDEESFKTPLFGIKVLHIVIDPEDIRPMKISFKFVDVSEGTYGIRCFQDVNGNGKMDRGLFGPKEPWWLSYQEESHSRFPKFKDIAFPVNSDVDNIQIDLS
jgi:hypothetical protein